MKKYYHFLFTLSLSVFLLQSCGSKETQSDTNTAQKDSLATPPKETATDNITPNYVDTLVAKWVEVGENEEGRYVHSVNQDPGEMYILVEKKDSGYYLTTRNLDIDMPGPDVYKIDSVQRVFAGQILNTYEYVVNVTNIKNNEKRELNFTPLHQSMQNAIRISGFGPDDVHQYFMNDKLSDMYLVRNED